jgi:hypothetical protein
MIPGSHSRKTVVSDIRHLLTFASFRVSNLNIQLGQHRSGVTRRLREPTLHA